MQITVQHHREGRALQRGRSHIPAAAPELQNQLSPEEGHALQPAAVLVHADEIAPDGRCQAIWWRGPFNLASKQN
jgi:hypothetical protein